MDTEKKKEDPSRQGEDGLGPDFMDPGPQPPPEADQTPKPDDPSREGSG